MKKEVTTQALGSKSYSQSELVSSLLAGQPFVSKFGEEENQFSNARFELSRVLGTLQCRFTCTVTLSNKNHYGHVTSQEIEI